MTSLFFRWFGVIRL